MPEFTAGPWDCTENTYGEIAIADENNVVLSYMDHSRPSNETLNVS
jgi:hypothetical protein